jgi:hypothetical protein
MNNSPIQKRSQKGGFKKKHIGLAILKGILEVMLMQE